MPATGIDSTEVEYFLIPHFEFASGHVQDVKIAYRSFNSSSPKAVLIPTCFGGRINSTLNFTSGCLSSYHVIVVAMLGNGESSSPSNDPKFPSDYSLRYQDNINAQHALVTQHLGLKNLEAVIGFSMGGQQAYYWAVMHGSSSSEPSTSEPFLKNAVVICGSAKTSGHNYAFLEGPISALETSHDYEQGKYKAKGIHPSQGLRAFGRAYAAWLTSAEWFRQELWRDWIGVGSLKEWLYPAEGEGPFESWDPEDLLTLARQWQAGDVGAVAGGGDYRKALAGVTAGVLVMPSMTDQYFDWKDGENEMKFLKKGVWMPIPTVWGHIAGGGANKADVEWMDEKIGEFLGGRHQRL